MIDVKLEKIEFQREPPEACTFCGQPGRYWSQNTPMCKHCADTHKVTDIEIAKIKPKTVAPW